MIYYLQSTHKQIESKKINKLTLILGNTIQHCFLENLYLGAQANKSGKDASETGLNTVLLTDLTRTVQSLISS